MRLSVDPSRCQGHTMCSLAAPDLFLLDDVDGHASPAVDPVPPADEGVAQRAVIACPERAVSLEL
ncbi:ferredoxin [Nocardia beijingensis]